MKTAAAQPQREGPPAADNKVRPGRVRNGDARARWITTIGRARERGLQLPDLWVAVDINTAADNATCVATRKIKTMAERLQLSTRQVERSTARLRDAGLLTWTRPHKRAANRYVMQLPRWAFEATPESAQTAAADVETTPGSCGETTPESGLYPTVTSTQPSDDESATQLHHRDDDAAAEGWPDQPLAALAGELCRLACIDPASRLGSTAGPWLHSAKAQGYSWSVARLAALKAAFSSPGGFSSCAYFTPELARQAEQAQGADGPLTEAAIAGLHDALRAKRDVAQCPAAHTPAQPTHHQPARAAR